MGLDLGLWLFYNWLQNSDFNNLFVLWLFHLDALNGGEIHEDFAGFN
jgi:hypothetical protein